MNKLPNQLEKFPLISLGVIQEKTAVDGGSMRTVDSKAEKANGGSMLAVDGSMKTKAEKERDGSMKTKAGETSSSFFV